MRIFTKILPLKLLFDDIKISLYLCKADKSNLLKQLPERIQCLNLAVYYSVDLNHCRSKPVGFLTNQEKFSLHL